MREEALLIGISQLGAVFAGFIAIFMVFTQANGKFSPVDTLRARIIIFSSFVLVLAALLPLAMNGLAIAPAWIWPIATLIYLILAGMISIDVVRRQRALSKEEAPDRNTRIFQIIARILNIALFVTGILIIAGIGQGGYYILALLINLIMAGITFISFATHRLFD